MKYKIVKKYHKHNDVVSERFYVMKEHKPWWSSKPRWKHCREFTYASYDSWKGERVSRNTLEKAEEYVDNMIKSDAIPNETQDIKIIEATSIKRERKLNDLLD